MIAQCAAGVIGSMPALNARPQEKLTEWLTEINTTLSQLREQDPERLIAPYAVNLIIHRSNDRVEADLAVCAEHRVPIIITSLSAPHRVVDAVHDWGGKGVPRCDDHPSCRKSARRRRGRTDSESPRAPGVMQAPPTLWPWSGKSDAFSMGR